MIVNVLIAGLILLAATANDQSSKDTQALPSQPNWRTSDHDCSWRWIQGGGLGMWSEVCQLSTGQWRIDWDDVRKAFVLQHDNQQIELVVQPWEIAKDTGISSLSTSLGEAGFLQSDHHCYWERVSISTSTANMRLFELRSLLNDDIEHNETSEVPEDRCGPYGQSTHGVRYFMVDRHSPDLAIFVNEGQERPMFDPSSITVLH